MSRPWWSGPQLADSETRLETERGILLTPYTDELDAQMAATRRAAKQYRMALRQLAK